MTTFTYPTKTQARRNFPGEPFPGGNYLYCGTWYHLVKDTNGYTFIPRDTASPVSFGTFRV